MRRSLVLAVLALAWLPVSRAQAGVPLGEAWARVQQAVEKGELQQAGAEVSDLVRLANRMAVRRMPTWGRSLAILASKASPATRETILGFALRLDPGCPEAYFLRSRWEWGAGSRGSAVVDYLRGWRAILADPYRSRELGSSAVGWLLLSLLIAGLLGLAVETSRFLPELGHDSLELGRILFTASNAQIFAAVAVALPLFAGLGPVWLLAYLFALCWVYFPIRERILFGIVWAVVMLALPSLWVWQGWALAERTPVDRAVTMIESNLAMPFTVEELLSLSAELNRVPSFHILAGEATHAMGETLVSTEQFGRAALAAPEDPIPHVWMGNLALEEGDTRLAIQEYRKAIQKRPDLGMAYFDLSVALDQDHLFTEADKARNRARALGLDSYPYRFHEVDGLKLAYPNDARLLLQRLRAETPREKQRFVSAVTLDASPWELLGSPWSLAFLSTGILGLLAWWARRRWMWTAQSCLKCGKVFCPRCKTTDESRSYCSQCIAVFLTRGAVSIEQQAAKTEQIRRRQRILAIVRRLFSLIVPGFGDLVRGKAVRGMLNVTAAVIALTGALLWAPLFARPISDWVGAGPLRVALLVVFAVSWLVGLRRGWVEA